MPYKDVYQLGVRIRSKKVSDENKFKLLAATCEYRQPWTGDRILTPVCKISGNKTLSMCCMQICKALLE